ncbi:amino acid adenylation domain-containing protein [Oikeobacillus pervagus]|uniref:Amino acid adenylation domain-containing protein n=1 Tax=Oikeobacillus pervagus TaxID=1325931 RepID=A0AAJ1T387_9BACI|nr:amino acid adenylation domain-containing protein [Oikeobacillus pervagus]MDQ0215109.1 amino acid adenylation domain-containing protein [Oikeobacillus pervagus]
MTTNNKFLHSKFEDMALKFPNKIAIKHENKSITYNELNQLANGIALTLLNNGIKIGDRIGIVMERSIEMIIGMLGALKVGASYIPLDPLYPKDRINYCLSQAKVNLVLYQTSTSNLLKNDKTKINMDELEPEKSINLPITLTKNEIPAYIIYTSGSTGNPKGVVISHKAIVNHMEWMENEFEWTMNDVFLQKTASGFDASIWEIYAPLSCGALMIIGTSNPFEIADSIKQNNITVVQFVPTVLKLLVEQNQLKKLNSLRLIFSGGEPLHIDLVNSIHNELKIPLINLYGPTEATIDTTFHVCLPEDSNSYLQVPLGKPITNVEIKIVDEQIKEVEVGYSGELMILGEGLALEYFEMPELTNKSFIIDPSTGKRAYLSGDIVKIKEDKTLEFIGRKDNQIKLRGLRIELGEIEVLMRQIPFVNDAIVNVVSENETDWIVAYIRCDEHLPKYEGEIRKRLSDSLPNYMIPNYFVFLREFLYLENGKIDRKKLFLLQFKNKSNKAILMNGISKKIQELWTTLLGQEVNSMDESFQNLGGHSLLAMRLTSKLSYEFNIDLPHNFVFYNPTINKQSQFIEKNSENKTKVISTITHQIDEDLVAPLSMGQQGILFFEDQNDKSAYHISFQLEIKNGIGFEEVSKNIKVLQKKHPILLASIDKDENGELVQRYNEDIVEQNYKKISATSKDNINEIIKKEISKSFDLQKGGFRYFFIQTENSNLAIITFHHIIADGLSTNIFFDELDELLSDPKKRGFEEVNKSFFKFAKSQANTNDEKGLEFWKEYLNGIPDVSRFPASMMKQTKQTRNGSRLTIQLPEILGKNIENLSREKGQSEFSFYFGAAASILAKYSGQRDVCIGVPNANRRSEEEYGAIGNFVNVIPFRINFPEEVALLDIVSNITRDYKELIQFDNVPIEYIIQKILKKRSANHRPLFQVMFVYNRFSTSNLYSSFEVSHAIDSSAKCDLSFIVEYTESSIQLIIEYCTDLFERETIEYLEKEWVEQLNLLIEEQPLLEIFEKEEHIKDSNIKEYGTLDQLIIEQVRNIWNDVLKVEKSDINTDFFDLGGHSLLAMKLINLINKHFSVTLPVSTLFEYPTIEGIAYKLSHINNIHNGVVHLYSNHKKNKIWFIHPAGGQLWCYNDIAKDLKESFDIYGIESAPISNENMQFDDNLLSMAESYALKIMNIQSEGPIYLVGYSFGGVLAYEIAKILQEKDLEIGSLFLLDCHLPKNEEISDFELVFSYASKFTNGSNDGISISYLKEKNKTDLLSYLLELGKKGKHLHDDADIKDVEKGLGIWIANNRAITSHKISNIYSGKVLFVRAEHSDQDSTIGWEQYLKGEWSIFNVPAHHFTIYAQPSASIIADKIKQEVFSTIIN